MPISSMGPGQAVSDRNLSAAGDSSSSTRSSSAGGDAATSVASRWKRSSAAAWLGESSAEYVASAASLDASDCEALCESLVNSLLDTGRAGAAEAPRQEERDGAEALARAAAELRRHRDLWQDMLEEEHQGAVWSTAAEPWTPAPGTWKLPQGEPDWQRQEHQQRPPAEAGRPRHSEQRLDAQASATGADAAAGGASAWSNMAWGERKSDIAESASVRDIPGKGQDLELRFCVWCGQQVPPNLVHCKFCTFCGKMHRGGQAHNETPSAPISKFAESSQAGSTAPSNRVQKDRSTLGGQGEADLSRAEALWNLGAERREQVAVVGLSSSAWALQPDRVGLNSNSKWEAMSAGERIMALVNSKPAWCAGGACTS